MWFMVIVSIKLTHKLNILSEIVLTKLIFIPVKQSSVDLLDLSFEFFHNCWHWKCGREYLFQLCEIYLRGCGQLIIRCFQYFCKTDFGEVLCLFSSAVPSGSGAFSTAELSVCLSFKIEGGGGGVYLRNASVTFSLLLT